MYAYIWYLNSIRPFWPSKGKCPWCHAHTASGSASPATGEHLINRSLTESLSNSMESFYNRSCSRNVVELTSTKCCLSVPRSSCSTKSVVHYQGRPAKGSEVTKWHNHVDGPPNAWTPCHECFGTRARSFHGDWGTSNFGITNLVGAWSPHPSYSCRDGSPPTCGVLVNGGRRVRYHCSGFSKHRACNRKRYGVRAGTECPRSFGPWPNELRRFVLSRQTHRLLEDYMQNVHPSKRPGLIGTLSHAQTTLLVITLAFSRCRNHGASHYSSHHQSHSQTSLSRPEFTRTAHSLSRHAQVCGQNCFGYILFDNMDSSVVSVSFDAGKSTRACE